MKTSLLTSPFTVVRDTREQVGHGWVFPADPSSGCTGTLIKKLATGDYSLIGMENFFCIERKRNTAELAQNIFEKRFENELVRMEKFLHPFIICEFTVADIASFPINSGIPYKKHTELRVSANLLMRKFLEYQIDRKVKIITAGKYGMEIAVKIFKQMRDKYGGKK